MEINKGNAISVKMLISSWRAKAVTYSKDVGTKYPRVSEECYKKTSVTVTSQRKTDTKPTESLTILLAT